MCSVATVCIYMMTNDARCTCDVKSRIAMATSALDRKKRTLSPAN
jgi:hypothetical protein